MNKGINLLFINLLVLCAILLVVELSCAIILDHREFEKGRDTTPQQPENPDQEWVKKFNTEFNSLESTYKSYIGWRKKPFQGKLININEEGLRATSSSNTPGDSLIVFLGGSTTWGTGVADDQTLPSYFAKHLSFPATVLNYGESGYTAFQNYIFFQQMLMKGAKPTLVISTDGVNNSPAFIAEPFENHREDQIIKAMKGQDSWNAEKPYFLKSTRLMLQILKSKKKKVEQGEPKVFSAERNKAAAKELLESWLLIKNSSESIGAEFYCILQPNAFVGNPQINPNRKDILNNSRKNGYEYYKEVISLLNTEEYSTLQPHFIDLRFAVDHMKNVYMDFCHLYPEGNEKLAVTLMDSLQKRSFLTDALPHSKAFQ